MTFSASNSLPPFFFPLSCFSGSISRDELKMMMDKLGERYEEKVCYYILYASSGHCTFNSSYLDIFSLHFFFSMIAFCSQPLSHVHTAIVHLFLISSIYIWTVSFFCQPRICQWFLIQLMFTYACKQDLDEMIRVIDKSGSGSVRHSSSDVLSMTVLIFRLLIMYSVIIVWKVKLNLKHLSCITTWFTY